MAMGGSTLLYSTFVASSAGIGGVLGGLVGTGIHAAPIYHGIAQASTFLSVHSAALSATAASKVTVLTQLFGVFV